MDNSMTRLFLCSVTRGIFHIKMELARFYRFPGDIRCRKDQPERDPRSQQTGKHGEALFRERCDHAGIHQHHNTQENERRLKRGSVMEPGKVQS